jgi:hypothetical protein
MRGGVSLLEVMFSIGVVMIGLVGVAALLPLGGALARRGAIADAAAQLGANAAREFGAREMAVPDNWRWYNGTTFNAVTVAPHTLPPGISFCLDPLYISRADPNETTYAAEITRRNQFPVNAKYDTNLLWMPRITLASPWTPNGVLAPVAARDIFVSSDDLVFDLPGDRTLGPVQNFLFQNAAPVNPLKRTAEGGISWLATIVPKFIVDPSTGTPVVTDEYIVSFVVLNRRNTLLLDPLSGNTLSESEIGERVARAGMFYSGSPAFSGGDLTLATRSGRPADDLELRSGDWVLFSRNLLLGGAAQMHKWYRVINPGEAPVYDAPQYASTPMDNLWTREITVVGADWNWDPQFPTQVTIVRGAVEVLEKTIRLESSSLWTN